MFTGTGWLLPPLRRSVGIAVVLVSLLGCKPPGAAVSGKVLLDGTPLDDATITFIPASGSQRDAAWTMVSQGQYAIDAAAGLGTGAFRVEIRALRSVGDKANQNDPTLVTAREIIPSKYNSKSELTCDVKPGMNEVDFSLQSK